MISVIIVNYHSAYMTKRAVDSVLQEDEDMEVFVVDNTATVEEGRVLKSFLPGNINLIFNETNEGFGRACNRAYRASRGKWIFLLNPDAYVLPGTLKKLKQFLVDHPPAAAAGPVIYWDDRKRFMLPPNYLPRPSHKFLLAYRCRIPALTHLYALKWRWWALRVLDSASPLEQYSLSGGSVLLRRDSIETAGGLFDEGFFLYYEDSDLFLRLRQSGHKLYLLNSTAVIHNYNQIPEAGISKIGQALLSHNFYMKKHFSYKYAIINELDRMMTIFNSDRKLSDIVNLGRLNAPFSIPVPDPLKDGWIFEWSHDSNLFPAAIMQGKGKIFEFPEKAWSLFKPGRFFGRLSSPEVFFVKPATLVWEVV